MEKITDLKVKSDKELNIQLHSFKRELLNLRFQLKVGELKNTARINLVKKQVARIKTILCKNKCEVKN